jgi:GNAT superfamily N-acetyltransferase
MLLPPGYEAREVQADDFVAITELTNRIEQEKLTPEDHLGRWRNKSRNQWRRVVTHGGQIVAYVGCLQAITGGGDIYLIRVDVDDSHRNQGIGKTLLAEAEEAGRQFGARILTTKARDDMPREKRFLEAANYDAFENMRGVTLDLTSFAPPATSRGSEEIVSWAEIGDSPANRRRLYEMYRETDKDSPGIDVWGMPDFENWETGIFTGSWYRPESLFVAVENGEWIGLAIVGPMEDNIWTTDYTGVLPAHRGKGIGTRLKLRGIEHAMNRQGRELHTFNDELNGPMRAINSKLGFKPETGWWMYRKDP